MWRHGLVPPSGPRRRGHDPRHAQAAQHEHSLTHSAESHANFLWYSNKLLPPMSLVGTKKIASEPQARPQRAFPRLSHAMVRSVPLRRSASVSSPM